MNLRYLEQEQQLRNFQEFSRRIFAHIFLVFSFTGAYRLICNVLNNDSIVTERLIKQILY